MSEGKRDSDINDGNEYSLEISQDGRIRQLSFANPVFNGKRQYEDAEAITELGELISREFDTPAFKAEPDRDLVVKYLAPCFNR